MSLSFQDLQEAIYLDDKDEFLIYQNSSQRNKRVKRGNLFNSRAISIRGEVINPSTNENLYDVAKLASINAGLAQATAAGAQNTANGKSKVYYQIQAPTGGTYGSGDLWYDIDDDYKLYVRSAGNWVPSFAPMITFGTSGKISGLLRADQDGNTSGMDFVLIADNFQIWNGTSAEVPFEIKTITSGTSGEQVVRIKNAQIQTVDAGKLTAGFIGAQAIEFSSSGGYIQSKDFIETWVTGKVYKTTRTVVSDQTRVKVLQNNGTYLIYNCIVEHTSGTFATDLSNGKWALASPVPSIQGFRLVATGECELADMIVRGTIYSSSGHFGNTANNVLIDGDGLVVGTNGKIRSVAAGYESGSFTGYGFALGTFDGAAKLFVGTSGGNNLTWNGSNLLINGSLVATSSGASGGAGVTISSGFGIRYINKTSVLTITGGDENGVQAGSQIDFVGVDATGAAGQANGQLILSAGYKKASGSNAEASGFTDFYDGSIVFRTGYGSDINEGANLTGVRRLIIERNGTVTVGRKGDSVKFGAPNSGDGKLIVETSVEAPTYTSTSSKRFKKKIKNFKNGLKIISKLRPVVFDWKTKDLKNDIGLIAEEVNEVVPNLVGLNNNGEIMGVDYGKLTPILIQAVKELELEIQKLKNKIG